MSTVAYSVPDISCEGCANAIKRALGTLRGVESVAVDVQSKRVTVDYAEDQVGPEDIRRRIDDAGYEPEQISA